MQRSVVVKCEGCGAVFEVFYRPKGPGNNAPYFSCHHCGRCYPIKPNIIHEIKRTPALGWNPLTTIEAIADSSKTLLGRKNYQQAERQLNKLLGLVRGEIEKRKTDKPVPRCEFRETPRTRCNKTPVFEHNHHFFCGKHFGGKIQR
jgi:hypothetical protein